MTYQGLPTFVANFGAGLPPALHSAAMLALAGALMFGMALVAGAAYLIGERVWMEATRPAGRHTAEPHALAQLEPWTTADLEPLWIAECRCGASYSAPRRHAARHGWSDHAHDERAASK